MKNTITAPSKQKDITLPSNGLYNSFIGTELDSAIENDSYHLSEQKAFELSEYMNTSDAYHRASRKVNERMILEYGAFLINWLNDEYDTSIKASDYEYVPMDGRNQGDTLHCMIDADSLPPLATLSDKIDGFADKLTQLAIDRLSSHSGFISFYSNDITPLLIQPYSVWGDAYIMLIIELMLSDTGNDIADIEQYYLESLNTCGGSIEYLFNALDQYNCNLLNDIIGE